jgi:hypothetical protein
MSETALPDSTIDIKLRKKAGHRSRIWLLVFVVLIVWSYLHFSAGDPNALKWYISPPLDAAGDRIKFLYPVGWEPAPNGITITRGTSKKVNTELALAMIRIEPRRPFRTFPGWLQRLLLVDTRYGCVMAYVWLYDVSPIENEKQMESLRSTDNRTHCSDGPSFFVRPGLLASYEFSYANRNRTMLSHTQAAVEHSLKIER